VQEVWHNSDCLANCFFLILQERDTLAAEVAALQAASTTKEEEATAQAKIFKAEIAALKEQVIKGTEGSSATGLHHAAQRLYFTLLV
jgi:hypothetical protein